MKYPTSQFEMLANSRLCYHVILSSSGVIHYANHLFRQQYLHAGSTSIHQLLQFDDREKLAAIFRQPGQPNGWHDVKLHLLTGSNQGMLTQWEFCWMAGETEPVLQGIGTAGPETSNATATLLRKNEQDEKYKFLFYKNPMPMWIYEVGSLRFLEVNDAAIACYGYTREEFLELTIKDIRPGEDVDKLLALQKTSYIQNNINTGLWRHKKKNGEVIDVFVRAHMMLLNGRQAKMVLAEDRTEQIRTQHQLTVSNERYLYASKATFDAIWDWDMVANKIYRSEGFRLLFGYPAEEMDTEGLVSLFTHTHPDDRERIRNSIQRAISGTALSWLEEYRFKKADGTMAYIIDRCIIIRDGTGKAIRLVGAMQDNTIRKINEQQLQKINLQLLKQQKERQLTASILRSLSEKELLNDALEDILRKLTVFFHFDIGEAWFVNLDKERLELRQKWFGARSLQIFYDKHPDVTTRFRSSDTGHTWWNDNEIVFIDELQQAEGFLRKTGAAQAGITNSLVVPILFRGEPIALFSFFGHHPLVEKEKVRQYFEALSLQLGLDIRRKKTEEELNNFFELSPDILAIIGIDGYFKKINNAFTNMLGFGLQSLSDVHFEELTHPNDLEVTARQFALLQQGQTVNFENRLRTKDGKHCWLSWAAAPVANEGLIFATAKNITDKKELDDRLHRILESISDGFLTVDGANRILYWNKSAEQLLHLKREDVIGKKASEVFRSHLPSKLFELFKQAMEEQAPLHFEEFVPQFNRWFDVTAYPSNDLMSVYFKDVSERKKWEEKVRMASERYDGLAKATRDAIWDWNIITNRVTWNEGLFTLFNYKNVTETDGDNWWAERLHPEDRQRVITKVKEHLQLSHTNWEAEYRFKSADGTYKYIYDRGFTIYDDQNRAVRMIGAMQDLTETKANERTLQELNDSLELRAAQLAASNAELESFAYVASHDLQEPLRMVSSFLQLIEKKYKDKLDAKGHEYIRFAVDGAERMKGLIMDLLEYSRVHSRKEEKKPVDLNQIAESLHLTYKSPIDEAGGTLIIDDLPVVTGNAVQLLQVFQNLVGNAIKYRSNRPPQIHIGVTQTENAWTFFVRDNGIGIEPRFFNKIFVIFQRLHGKSEYGGTGIGLAICKKIIDLHDGQIWVDSVPGEGSTFYFTIPQPTVA